MELNTKYTVTETGQVIKYNDPQFLEGRQPKEVNFCGCSFTVDTVNKRDLNRMQRQKQKLNRKVRF